MHRACSRLLVVALTMTVAGSAHATDGATAAAWRHFRARSVETVNALNATARVDLAATDAVELSFDEFFGPVGDEGLSLSERLQSLAGKRVRLSGFMLREAQRRRGVFLLVRSARPGEIDSACAATGVPPAVVYVHLRALGPQTRAAYMPGRLTLTGVLEIGAQREAEGGNSHIRLLVDDEVLVDRRERSTVAEATQ